MDVIVCILGGSCGAAIVTAGLAFVQHMIDRRDSRSGNADVQRQALRYLMLYIIQERAKQHILAGSVSLEDRRLLHCWHELYHKGLGGNGDADVLLRQVDGLKLDPDAF